MADNSKKPSAGIPPGAIWAVVGLLCGLLLLVVVLVGNGVHLKKQAERAQLEKARQELERASQELEKARQEAEKARQEWEGRKHGGEG
jgi:hypothetical protein